MNKAVVAAVGVVAVGAAVALGVWASSQSEPEAREPSATPPAVAEVEAPAVAEVEAPAPPRRNGTRLPESLRDDVARHRRRLERAVALGLTVDAKPDAAGHALPPADEADEARQPWPTDPDGIRSAVAEVTAEARDCVEGYGPEVGEFDGSLVLSFTVGTPDDGGDIAYPQDLTLDAEGIPAPVASCVTSVYSQMAFEPSDQPVGVNYPITLVFSAKPADQ